MNYEDNPRIDNYTTEEASHVSGIAQNNLRHLEAKGVVVPSIRAAAGKGKCRLYDFGDLLALRLCRSLLDAGVSVAGEKNEVWKTLAIATGKFFRAGHVGKKTVLTLDLAGGGYVQTTRMDSFEGTMLGSQCSEATAGPGFLRVHLELEKLEADVLSSIRRWVACHT